MAGNTALKRSGYTWNDYRSWDNGQRWEIVGGQAYAMAPAPATRHQIVTGELFGQLREFFAGKKCRPAISPVDVKLSQADVVQPDIVVVCDPRQIRPSHIEGAPAHVVEVLSPFTEVFDRGRKMDLYARSGVKEVWLVTPYPSLIEVFLLADGGYRRVHAYAVDESFESPSFPGLELNLPRLFDFQIAPGERIDMVREGRPPYGRKPGRTGSCMDNTRSRSMK